MYDYNKEGNFYSRYRKADPRIKKLLMDAVGPSKTVLNVGAGTGSYEPVDRDVVAVEPSIVMCQQRAKQLVRPIRAIAESLPFTAKSFEKSLAILTMHHWSNPLLGLRELRRVTSVSIVLLTTDPYARVEFWFQDYCPEMAEVEHIRFGRIGSLIETLGGTREIRTIPVPIDCTDLFQEALYGRPEMFLNPEIRKSQSGWSFLPSGVEERVVRSIKKDLESGEWDRKYGDYRSKPFIDSQLRIIILNF
jgi:SAM-dependent methyltransferase